MNRPYIFSIVILLIQCCYLTAQPIKVLHYTETSGYDHQTRMVSLAMFEQMGLQHGFTVDDDNTGAAFNTLANLQQYDVIVFSNTSGNNILNSTQQQHFMQYMDDGGGFVGIHAASDTYRHSTSNGSNTGSWDWYAEMLGASVQENPNHVNGTPVYRIDHINSHQLLTGVPNPWFKAEEYYYWENGYFGTMNNVLLQVEETVGPNGMVNSYDAARAVSWYRVLSGGGRVFYTSLGHDVSNYTSDLNFYTLLENAVLWAGDNSSSINTAEEDNEWNVYPNPFGDKIFITITENSQKIEVKIFSLQGILLANQLCETNTTKIFLNHLAPGLYIAEIGNAEGVSRIKLIKKE